MTTPRIISAIEHLDNDLIEEAIAGTPKVKLPQRIKWQTAAACLCVLIAVCGFTVVAISEEPLQVVETGTVGCSITDNPYINNGSWSETYQYDVSGSFIPNGDISEVPNVDISKKLSFSKGESKSWHIKLANRKCGVNAEQDTLTVNISNDSTGRFYYICEDLTTHTELANFMFDKGITRVLSNLHPEHQYEITIIYIDTQKIPLDIHITSYNSANGIIITD